MKHLRSLPPLLMVLFVSAAGIAQPSFRIRSDTGAPLNSDQGWSAGTNESVSVHADDPFRIRFEVETGSGVGGIASFQLHHRRNGGEWIRTEAHDFPHPESENAKTPRVSVVSCAALQNGAATVDLLKGSTAPFQAGTGIALADRTPAWGGAGAHGEFEWAVVVRRFADGAVTNEPGDTFDFKMIPSSGASQATSPVARVRLVVRPGHVGGTYVETPGRIGPWQARNGDLYFIMEPAETSNLFMIVKSNDGGRTWREVDPGNRPPTRDLESVDARLVGDTLHIVHQVTRSARYHSFRTSDHPRSRIRGRSARSKSVP